MSPELVAYIEAFTETYTSRSAPLGQGTIVSTINEMSDDEVRSSASELLTLASRIDREYYTVGSGRLLGGS
jgi:hypothetical protein